jgi:hypothetical protein
MLPFCVLCSCHLDHQRHRHSADGYRSPATPFRSASSKVAPPCDAAKPFRIRSYTILPGVTCVASPPVKAILGLPKQYPLASKKPKNSPVFSWSYAPFYIPYALSPLFATLAKTTGGVPTSFPSWNRPSYSFPPEESPCALTQ